MGDGVISRTFYTPALRGLWRKAARKLTGDKHGVEWPNTYPAGLTDFTAHLQMLDIELRGRLDGAITSKMVDRIKEHSARIPSSVFYAVMSDRYAGTDRATALCLDDDNVVGDYVRCDGEACELAERIFACNLLLDVVE